MFSLLRLPFTPPVSHLALVTLICTSNLSHLVVSSLPLNVLPVILLLFSSLFHWRQQLCNFSCERWHVVVLSFPLADPHLQHASFPHSGFPVLVAAAPESSTVRPSPRRVILLFRSLHLTSHDVADSHKVRFLWGRKRSKRSSRSDCRAPPCKVEDEEFPGGSLLFTTASDWRL